MPPLQRVLSSARGSRGQNQRRCFVRNFPPMPTVSVIIPTCNRADFLRVALESVQRQTFQNFETLVIDDASQDRTPEVVRSFPSMPVRYFRHESRKGGAAARNTGIVHARGDYLAFLDDDDEWLPDKLRQQVDLLDRSPAEVGVVYTGYVIVDRRSGREIARKTATRRGNIARFLFEENSVGGTSSVMVRKECFARVGLFDEQLPSFQDYDLWIRLAQEFQFDYLPGPLLKYYVHGKKIWTDLAALDTGMEILLKKYDYPPGLKKQCSYYYRSLGIQYCQRGDLANARRAFTKAVKLYPFDAANFLRFVLSWLPLVSAYNRELRPSSFAPLRMFSDRS